jgi:enoyl-CoA hydratase
LSLFFAGIFAAAFGAAASAVAYSRAMTAIDTGIDTLTPVADLSVTLIDGVLSVIIDRPESLNSVTTPVLTGIADAMEHAAADPRVRVVRLGGAGRGFCSGAGMGADDVSGSGGQGTDIIAAANRAVRAITAVPRPVVAVVQGPCAGVGVSLALACDLVLASDAAFFMLAFTKVGLMPDGGASALVAAAIGRTRALRMALLAERLPATDALASGLISAVYPAEEFDSEVSRVVSTLLRGPAVAFAKTKQAINAATLTELEPALHRELQGQAQLLKSHDFREGATAFQQRRPPNFTDR